MHKRTFATSALLTALVLVGCSDDDDDDTAALVDPDDGTSTPADTVSDGLEGASAGTTTGLEGRWRGRCRLNETIGLYERRTNEVEGDEYTVFVRSFADEDCTEKTILTEIGGTLTTDEPEAGNGTVGGEVDLVVDAIRMTPLSAEGAAQLNAIAFCDRADYEVDVVVDIESCSTLGIESVPYPQYDRFLVEDDTLYVGPMLATTPETRPEEVDFTDPYSRSPSDGGADDGPVQDGVGATALEGRWRGPCMLSRQFGVYQRDTLDITGTNFVVVDRTFADEACTQEIVTVEAEGTLSARPATSADRAISGEIDQRFETLRLTPLVSDAADRLSAIALCERTDYTAGTTTELASCPEVGVEGLPGTAYNRYLIEDDTLYFGAEPGTSLETRPEGVSRDVGYSRLP